ncbi:hypothetical protein [Streptomyces sp. SID12488]|uniref:hypothetical protein n=1 Tax=Streptomyces sp. SID12488 TaxID=2706040 RepID=UPI001EF1E21F|nr:hypothetical protein [Streptomyces sp. SID12488]
MTDIVVTDGSGAGRALAAGPDSSPAVTTPAAMVAAQARLRPLLPPPLLLALNSLNRMDS